MSWFAKWQLVATVEPELHFIDLTVAGRTHNYLPKLKQQQRNLELHYLTRIGLGQSTESRKIFNLQLQCQVNASARRISQIVQISAFATALLQICSCEIERRAFTWHCNWRLKIFSRLR